MNSISSGLIKSLFTTLENIFDKDQDAKVPSDLLVAFHSVFGNNFSNALDLLDRNSVTVYSGEKSERQCAVVGGSSGKRYTVLVQGHYCPCQSYQYTVIQGRGAQYCKHLLALKLGLAMKRNKLETVSDERIREAFKVENKSKVFLWLSVLIFSSTLHTLFHLKAF